MEMVYDESWFQRFSSRSICCKGPEFEYPNYLFENGNTLIYFANLKLLLAKLMRILFKYSPIVSVSISAGLRIFF